MKNNGDFANIAVLVFLIVLCIGFYVCLVLISLGETKEKIQHPRIEAPIEVFVLPVNDTIADMCYDPRVMKVEVDTTYVPSPERICPVSPNRKHRRIINYQ